MKKADKKIIDENPGLSPYELFNKGISQEAYEELIEKESQSAAKPVKVEKIEQMPNVTVQPQRPQIRPAMQVTSNARLHNKTTGKVVSMSHKMAEHLARTSPSQYELLP